MCWRLVAIVLVACSLVGCGHAMQAERQAAIAKRKAAIAATFDTEKTKCETLAPRPPAVRPILPSVRCHNGALHRYALSMNDLEGGWNLPLTQLMVARFNLSAERFDQGKISATEYEAENAETQAVIHGQSQQQLMAKVAALAAVKQANAASAQAAAARRPVSCNRYGGTVTCY